MTQLGIDQSMGIRSRSKAGTALVPITGSDASTSLSDGRQPPNGHSTSESSRNGKGGGFQNCFAEGRRVKGDGREPVSVS